ncbi:MAG: endonuclease/exonuclease/phosphatase family protein [Phycisphaera sp.]|nr:MAG: endonuclease/exonuclease/phosphatase family protein [Phycisphaera sp.]
MRKTLTCLGVFLAGTLGTLGCSGAGSQGSNSTSVAPITPPMTIVLDSSIDDWPTGEVAVGDEYYLYVRFSAGEAITPQSNNETLVVSLDVDATQTTGHPTGEMGIDLEISFSPPYEGRIGNGTQVMAITPDGERVKLAPGLLDISVSPSHASEWFEMRIARRVPAELLLPEAGLLTSGRVRGKLSMFNASGKRVAEAPEFGAMLPEAAQRTKRVRASVPPKSLGSVRIVSYNVLNSSPMDEPEPFSRILRALDPDIVLVQEWYDTPADELGSWFNMHLPISGRWRAVTGEGRGVAVISRLDLAAIGPTGLVIAPEGEDRTVRVMPALAETPIGTMAVASVHLKCCGSLDSREDKLRIAESRAIAQMMEEQTRDIGPHVRVVAGDFNLVGGTEPLYSLVRGFDSDGTNAAVATPFVLGDNAMYTWTSPTSRFLPSRLDFAVYSDSSAVLERSFVFDPARLSPEVVNSLNLDELDAMVSDHRPVVIDLRAP